MWYGSSGSLLPGTQLRLADADGKDVEEYGVPGEVLFKSPNLFVGYLGNEEESEASFDADGWLRSGDVGMMKVGAGGNEHLFIRDRIKDMIKVKVSCFRRMNCELPCLFPCLRFRSFGANTTFHAGEPGRTRRH